MINYPRFAAKYAALSITGLLLTSQVAVASGFWTANLGLKSTHIARGASLANDKFSISPGMHIHNQFRPKVGFYAGFKGYSLGGVDPFFKYDAYTGINVIANKKLNFDATLISYQYPDAEGNDSLGQIIPAHEEDMLFKATFTPSKKFGTFTAAVAHGLNNRVTANNYYELTYSKPIGNLTFGAMYGKNDFAEINDRFKLLDYKHYQLSLKYKDFTLAVDRNDNDLFGVDNKVSLEWRKNFLIKGWK